VLAARHPSDSRRTYVLDTSVLLSDPRALQRFDEHDVVIPIVVIIELEAKRSHPELGYFARQALRLLDDLRVENGRLDEPMPVGESGGTVRVELNHTDPSVLPSGMRLGDNDTRILAVARNLQADGRHVVLVSKDLPMRVKASAVGLPAEEYRAEFVVETGFTGMVEIDVSADEIDRLYDEQVIEVEAARDLSCHTGLVLLSERGSALGRVTADKRVRLVRGDREAFGLHGRSAEQRIALDLLLDPDIGIVSLGGRAGTGKSALALCAGLEAVLERRQHRKVIVFRPLFAVGGQELGYLPGSESEKMSPWGQAVFDTLGAVTTQEPDMACSMADSAALALAPGPGGRAAGQGRCGRCGVAVYAGVLAALRRRHGPQHRRRADVAAQIRRQRLPQGPGRAGAAVPERDSRRAQESGRGGQVA